MDIAGKDKNTKFVQRLLNGGEEALDKRRERLGKYCEHFGLPDRIKRNYKDSHNVKEWWENMSAAINKKLEVAQFQIEAFNAGASEYRHNGNNNQKRLNKVFQEYISSIYDRKNDRDLLKRILKTLCVDSNSQNKYYKEGLKAFKLGFCFERSIMNT